MSQKIFYHISLKAGEIMSSSSVSSIMGKIPS